MWLTVEHVTRFAYDASINEAYTDEHVDFVVRRISEAAGELQRARS